MSDVPVPKERLPPGGRPTPLARRSTAVVSTGLGLLALAQASPASAAEPAAGVRWAPSTSGAEASDDGHVTGAVRLVADVSVDEPAGGWSLTVLTDALQPAFGVVCEQTFSRPRDSFRINCPWDTSRYPDGRPSPNQHYVVRVATRHGDALQPIGPDRPVALANPAAAPEDVAVAFDESTATVALTWSANPEPDLTHYDVEENIDGDGWARVGEPTETSFRRKVTEPGDHRYRVAAERSMPDGARSGPGRWARPDRHSDRVRVPSDTSPPSTAPQAKEGEPGDDTGRSRRARTGQRRGHDGGPASTPADRDGRRGASEPALRQRGAEEPPGAGPGPEAPPATASPGPANPVGATGPDASPGSDPGPAPADHASLTFSASSARALAALHDQPTPPTAITPAPAPKISPDAASAGHEPDAGFQAELPYPDTDRQADPPPPTTPPPAPAGDEVASPPDPADGPTRRHRHDHRREGVGLVLVAAGLLATALRPAPLRRSPRARRRRGREAQRIAALEQRLARLEQLLATSP